METKGNLKFCVTILGVENDVFHFQPLKYNGNNTKIIEKILKIVNNNVRHSIVKNGKNFKVVFLRFYWLWGLFLDFEIFTRVYRIANFFSNDFWNKRKVFIYFEFSPSIQHLDFHLKMLNLGRKFQKNENFSFVPKSIRKKVSNTIYPPGNLKMKE